MGLNFTYSLLSLRLIANSPFFTPSLQFNKNSFSFSNINCHKFTQHYLYTTSYSPIHFHKSSFQQFAPYNPVFIDSKQSIFLHNKRISQLWNWNIYQNQTYNETLIVDTPLTISVLFDNCLFQNCFNDFTSGGAIRFIKESGSLKISKCNFIKCTSTHESGVLFVNKYPSGDYLPATVDIEYSTVTECYDSDPTTTYVAGQIEVFVSRANGARGFNMIHSHFVNCQSSVSNKIVQGQIRLFANLFHMQYNNFSNSHQKIDLSAVVFSKSTQTTSLFSYTNLLNQVGNTNFEFYDINSGSVHIYRVNVINNTFVSYATGDLLRKISVFNLLLSQINTFYIDEFLCIDYHSIAVGSSEIVDPAFLILHTGSVDPFIYNTFSNINLNGFKTSVVEYLESLSYDYNSHEIKNCPSRKVNTPPYTDPFFQTTDVVEDEKDEKEESRKTDFNMIAVIVSLALIGVVGLIIIIIEVKNLRRSPSIPPFSDSDDALQDTWNSDLFYGSKKKKKSQLNEEIQMIENLI